MTFEAPCDCGRRLTLTAGLAGTALRCVCGQTVEVPCLHELQESPPTATPEPAHRVRAFSVFPFIIASLVGASVLCYGAALFLPAHHQGGGSLDGDLNLLGIDCLFTPFILPIILFACPSWWANPIYFFGLFASLRRWHGVSAGAGAIAALLAAGFAAETSSQFNHEQFRPGFWFWCAAMLVLGVAGGVGAWWGGADGSGRRSSLEPVAERGSKALEPSRGKIA